MSPSRAALCTKVALSAVALALGIAGGCSVFEERPPNVLLVSIDTLRADHLGAYGYARPTSPRLDAFAAESIRYARALAPTPWTLPSHAAMLTGRHPFDLGILDSDGTLPAQTPTLAETLRGQGYATAAFVDSDPESFVGGRRGFDRGFDRFVHAPHKTRRRHVYDMAATVRVALDWLDQREVERPFFLFLHTKSVHATPTDAAESDAPYDKPAPYRTRFLKDAKQRFPWRDDQVFGTALLRYWNEALASGEIPKQRFGADELEELKALYDGGVYYTDRFFGVLLDALRSRGLDRDTVVVVTADHGEAFLEHEFFLHQELFRELLEVPLIVRLPSRRNARVIPETVTLEDLMPTLLKLVGAEAPAGLTGQVLPGISGALPRAPRKHFAFFRVGPARAYEAFGVEDGQYLLIQDRRGKQREFRSALYDRRAGTAAVAAANPAVERALLSSLVGYFQPGAPKAAGTLKMSPETIELLRSLGYTE